MNKMVEELMTKEKLAAQQRERINLIIMAAGKGVSYKVSEKELNAIQSAIRRVLDGDCNAIEEKYLNEEREKAFKAGKNTFLSSGKLATFEHYLNSITNQSK